MKKILILLTSIILVISMVGCSDDDSPVTPTGTATTSWNATGSYWNSSINSTSYDEFAYFSFATKDTVTTGTPKVMASQAAVWDIAFKREAIKTNGGTSSNNSGDVETVSLGAVDFASVTIADTAGLTWGSDFIDHFIDEWFTYNPQNSFSCC